METEIQRIRLVLEYAAISREGRRLWGFSLHGAHWTTGEKEQECWGITTLGGERVLATEGMIADLRSHSIWLFGHSPAGLRVGPTQAPSRPVYDLVLTLILCPKPSLIAPLATEFVIRPRPYDCDNGLIFVAHRQPRGLPL